MKRKPLLVGIVILLIVLGIPIAGWATWQYELHKLKSPGRVTDETGVRLPPGVRIVSTRAQLFSLVDGDNYQWLIESDVSLLPWAQSIMKPEEGWGEDVRLMSELGRFADEVRANAKFGGVWRGYWQSPGGGREETSYLFLSADGKVGILETFRP